MIPSRPWKLAFVFLGFFLCCSFGCTNVSRHASLNPEPWRTDIWSCNEQEQRPRPVAWRANAESSALCPLSWAGPRRLPGREVATHDSWLASTPSVAAGQAKVVTGWAQDFVLDIWCLWHYNNIYEDFRHKYRHPWDSITLSTFLMIRPFSSGIIQL